MFLSINKTMKPLAFIKFILVEKPCGNCQAIDYSNFQTFTNLKNFYYPMSYQLRQNIEQTSDEYREKYKLDVYKLIQYQIILTSIVRIV